MNTTMKNLVCNLTAGTTLTGKWHHNHYTIVKQLGIGATGVVYLVHSPNGEMTALKLSFDNNSVTAEVNVLRNFSKVHGKSVGPFLFDVDDWVYRNQALSFYVMEYVKGTSLKAFIAKRGKEWVNVLAIQLLGDLHELHKEGWVFGDLKPENLVVSDQPVKVRLIDVGGTTMQGRAIKEFTDYYDRAYWGFGSRKAEPTYDLFAMAMIIIELLIGERLNKTDKPNEQLKKLLKTHNALLAHRSTLYKAVHGNYRTAYEMKQDLIEGTKGGESVTSVGNQKVRQHSPKRVKVKKKRTHFLETVLLGASVMFMYLLYLFIQVL
ncbi:MULTISPECIES: protein kinase family protein [Bacillaceae]|uniref:protein kinase domain-containing protein n=1 Tax=Bacillaceae TaxID=186817 RepID=UPI001051A322|nr:protein kinase family protein [Bacillus sp. CBEL-1]TDB47828.1 protein kinase family protein [Bacillus sp. CBEL-1]